MCKLGNLFFFNISNAKYYENIFKGYWFLYYFECLPKGVCWERDIFLIPKRFRCFRSAVYIHIIYTILYIGRWLQVVLMKLLLPEIHCYGHDEKAGVTGQNCGFIFFMHVGQTLKNTVVKNGGCVKTLVWVKCRVNREIDLFSTCFSFFFIVFYPSVRPPSPAHMLVYFVVAAVLVNFKSWLSVFEKDCFKTSFRLRP